MSTYKSFIIEKIGGKPKVKYSYPEAGLGGAIFKKEQEYLYRLAIQEYVTAFLMNASGKSFDAAKITISNRLALSDSDPLSPWDFIFKFLVTNTNYDSKLPGAGLLPIYNVSYSLKKFKELSGLTEEIITNYANDFLSSMIESQENEGKPLVVPSALDIRKKSTEINEANLAQAEKDKANEGLSQYGLSAVTGGNKTSYIIIGIVVLVIGYFIWKKKGK